MAPAAACESYDILPTTTSWASVWAVTCASTAPADRAQACRAKATFAPAACWQQFRTAPFDRALFTKAFARQLRGLPTGECRRVLLSHISSELRARGRLSHVDLIELAPEQSGIDETDAERTGIDSIPSAELVQAVSVLRTIRAWVFATHRGATLKARCARCSATSPTFRVPRCLQTSRARSTRTKKHLATLAVQAHEAPRRHFTTGSTTTL